MPAIIGKFITGTVLLLMAPSLAILATWNTLPGQTLYPVKRNLEDIASLVLSPSYQASSDLEIHLVSRRLEETERTLDQSSTAGLDELIAQAVEARTKVLSSNHTDAQTQQQAVKLARQLQNTKTKLQDKKQQLTSNTTSPTTTTSQVTQVTQVTQVVIQQTVIVQHIDTAQQQIDDIIDDIEEQTGPLPPETTSSQGAVQQVVTPQLEAPQTESAQPPSEAPQTETPSSTDPETPSSVPEEPHGHSSEHQPEHAQEHQPHEPESSPETPPSVE